MKLVMDARRQFCYNWTVQSFPSIGWGYSEQSKSGFCEERKCRMERIEIDANDLELYRNDEIVIDFPLPKPVEELLELLDRLYENGEDLKYNLYLNELHAYCKSLYGENLISKRQFEKLLDRYGAW